MSFHANIPSTQYDLVANRDTFGIKKETLVYIVVQFVCLSLYVIMGALPIFSQLIDYFVPYVMIINVMIWLELIISVSLPVLYAINADNRKKNFTDRDGCIEQLLKNQKSLEIIQEFATRSYCVEGILAWKDIQFFKTLKSEKRKQALSNFINVYLKIGAPLELNVPNVKKLALELNEKLEKDVDTDKNPLANIEMFCMVDLSDLIGRLAAENEYISNMIESIYNKA